jgi:lysophospholipase L1-like esterase
LHLLEKRIMKHSHGIAGVWAVAALLLGAGCDGGGGGGSGGHDFGANDPNVIVAMGDSITEGSGSADYPSILEGMVGKRVINHGRGGATAGDGAGAIGGVLAREKPGYVLILYGANDVISGTGLDHATGALGAIIEACKANQTVPIIATLTPMQGLHELFAGGAQELSRRIRSLAGQTGTALCDLESEFGFPSGLLQDDGLHPTDEGSVVIADSFASKL